MSHRTLQSTMLCVQVNALGAHAEFDDATNQLSQPFREEFEDVNNVLSVEGLPCFKEPEHLIEMDSSDAARQWDDRLSAESLHRLRCAYASMQVVRRSWLLLGLNWMICAHLHWQAHQQCQCKEIRAKRKHDTCQQCLINHSTSVTCVIQMY